MNKCLLCFLTLPIIASEKSNDALSSSCVPVPVRPVAIRASTTPRVDYPAYAPSEFQEGRAGETAPPASPTTPRRIKRNLMGFSRALPVEILAPGMLISFDSTTAVYKRGNRIEIRIHNNIDIDEDHSADASE